MLNLLSSNTFKQTKNTSKFLTLLIVLAILQGCATAAVAVFVSGASIINDRRSIGNQIDDQNIELTAYNKMANQKSIADNTNIHVVSVNGSVLIMGQVPNQVLKDLVNNTVSSVPGVVQIHDQIRIGSVTSVTTQAKDVWLTSKIKTALFSSEKINTGNIKVITENAEVFLMGLVSQKEANEAVDITRKINGVNRVFKVFEYIN